MPADDPQVEFASVYIERRQIIGKSAKEEIQGSETFSGYGHRSQHLDCRSSRMAILARRIGKRTFGSYGISPLTAHRRHFTFGPRNPGFAFISAGLKAHYCRAGSQEGCLKRFLLSHQDIPPMSSQFR